MEELEPWQIERPLDEGYYIWQTREYFHISGWTPWESQEVLQVLEDGSLDSPGPDANHFGTAAEMHQNYIMNWGRARRAKEKKPKPSPEDPLEHIRHLMEDAFINHDYRLMKVSPREAKKAADKLWKRLDEAPPVIGDWFVLLGELPPKTDDPDELEDYTEAAYGRILDVRRDYRIIFRVLGLKEDPPLKIPEETEVYPADPETGEADRSRPIRRIVDLEIGEVYSALHEDPETMLFGLREMTEKETIPALKRRRAGWKHLQEGLGARYLGR